MTLLRPSQSHCGLETETSHDASVNRAEKPVNPTIVSKD